MSCDHTLPAPHVVQLTQDDIPAMLTLERESFTLPWSEKEFLSAFTMPVFFAFGLRAQTDHAIHTPAGSLFAYISVYNTGDELEVLNIAVTQAKRRQGYGHCLLKTVLQLAEKMGILQAVLEVRVNNTPAIRLYERLGFSQIGVRRGYYPDTGEDALVYTRLMNQHPAGSSLRSSHA